MWSHEKKKRYIGMNVSFFSLFKNNCKYLVKISTKCKGQHFESSVENSSF